MRSDEGDVGEQDIRNPLQQGFQGFPGGLDRRDFRAGQAQGFLQELPPVRLVLDDEHSDAFQVGSLPPDLGRPFELDPSPILGAVETDGDRRQMDDEGRSAVFPLARHADGSAV